MPDGDAVHGRARVVREDEPVAHRVEAEVRRRRHHGLPARVGRRVWGWGVRLPAPSCVVWWCVRGAVVCVREKRASGYAGVRVHVPVLVQIRVGVSLCVSLRACGVGWGCVRGVGVKPSVPAPEQRRPPRLRGLHCVPLQPYPSEHEEHGRAHRRRDRLVENVRLEDHREEDREAPSVPQVRASK